MAPSEKQTLLKTQIEQLPTEARVIMLVLQPFLASSSSWSSCHCFAELRGWVKMTHAAALAAVALSVVFCRLPAALHTGSPTTAKTAKSSSSGSVWRSVVAAAFPLAVGIAADISAWSGFRITGGVRVRFAAAAADLLPTPERSGSSHRLGCAMPRGARFKPWASSKRGSGPSNRYLCIDMQRLSDEGPWPMAWMPRVTPKVEQLVVRAPERIIFTRFNLLRRSGRMRRGRWRRLL